MIYINYIDIIIDFGNVLILLFTFSCSVNWHEKSMNAKTYIIYLFVFGLKIPLIIIIFSYANIIHTIKKVSNKFKHLLHIMFKSF